MIKLSNPLTIHRQRKRLADLRPRLYRVALGWCGNPATADDLVQESSLKALKSLGRLEQPEALEGWVFRILSNCYRDLCRRAETLEMPEDLPDERQYQPEEILDSDSLVAQIRQAVERLKPNQREVLVMVDLGGFSYSETAQILSLPVGTVMSRLNRARQQLKRQLLGDPLLKSHTVSYMERVK